MKKISILAIALVATLLFACGGNKKAKLMAGEWKIADMVAPMPANVPDSMKTQFETAFKQQIEELKKSSHFSYKEDGTYTYNLASNTGGGTWKINEEGTELTLTDKGAQPEVSKIIELAENKLVIESKQPDGNSFTLTLVK